MRPANERWLYSVTPSLIGWAHMENDPWDSNEATDALEPHGPMTWVTTVNHYFCINFTHLGQNKMAHILQMTFSNTFSWMKMIVFSWASNQQSVPNCSDDSLVANLWQGFECTNDDRCIHALLSHNTLNKNLHTTAGEQHLCLGVLWNLNKNIKWHIIKLEMWTPIVVLP